MSEHRNPDAKALRALEETTLPLPPGLEIEWLGVSGYRLAYEGVSLFVDPYVSRVPLRALLLRRRALPPCRESTGPSPSDGAVPEVGFEPTRPEGHGILSAASLPFLHSGAAPNDSPARRR
jgi:hypothetical protein